MASLNGQTIASSYEQLLHTDTDGGGNGNTLVTIKDGDNGTTFGLKLATNKVEVIPSAADDANAFEVSKNDGTAVFTVNTSSPGLSLAGNATITTADNSDNIALVSTDADANSGPNMSFWRNSSSPADNDLLGQINWYAENDADEKTHMAQFYVTSMDVSDGTEDVRFVIQTILGGATETSRIELLPSETVINQDSKDIDFRVESDGNANMLVVDAGNNRVGIGTNSPAQILDVQGGRTHLKSSDEYNLRLYASNGDSGKFIGTPAGDKLNIYSDVGNAEVTVDASGNVGIGVSSPADVKGLHIKSNQDSDFPLLKLEADSTSRDASIVLITDGGNTFTIGIDATDSDKLKISDNAQVGVNDRLVIDSSGNVGIGEDSPTGLLELKASGNTNKYLTLDNATGNNFIQFGADNGAYACMWTEYGSGDLYIGTGVKPVGQNTNAFYSSYGGGNISRTAIVMDAFGDQGIKFHTASESTVAKDSAVTNDERMRLEHSGNLVMQNKTNGLANNIKFAGSATYTNSASTVHSLSGSGAIVLITNHSNDSSALFHMDYDHSTVTMIANPGGVDSDGFNNADSGDAIRVFKSAGTFSFTVKNSTGAQKNIGIGIISMHSS